MARTTTTRTKTTTRPTGTALLSEPGRLVAYRIAGRRCPVCDCRLTLGWSDNHPRLE